MNGVSAAVGLLFLFPPDLLLQVWPKKICLYFTAGETSSESVGPRKSSVRNVKVDPVTVPMGWIVLVGLAALPFQRPIAVETVGRHLFRVL